MKTNPRMLAVALAMLAGLARADMQPPPQGVVSLSSSATVEVTHDLLMVALSTTREGQDAAAVQSQLRQALDAALAEAKKVARPGQLEVQTGNFTISPRYTSKGQISGWQGSTELLIEGRDMSAIGALTGRISTLTVARVGHGLSRELREKTEGEVAARAIARFRAKAADYSQAFGYAGYTIREVNVSSVDQPPGMPIPMLRSKAMAASADESLPVEPGKGNVTISVNGTVQMTR
jgi:predicted secreted protein